MKRLISTMFLTVGAVLTLGLTANAQLAQQYRGNIPFDFQAGGQQFKAGDFSIGPQVTHGSVGLLTLRERKGSRKIASLGLVSLSNTSSSNKGKLIFVMRDGQYKLSQIMTPTFAVNMKRTWTDVKVSKKNAPADETIAILLQ